ncbi:MAG: hypothetical protein MRZ54_04700 [Clostridiales bacterium]|nr:hypothetical protein [Clostridiales bacterium]
MPMEKCYPTGSSTPLMIAGYVLVALGILLLFICIPCWAWLALLGVALMAAGVLLLRLSKAWR